MIRTGIITLVILVAGAFLVSGYQNIFTTKVKTQGGSYREGIVGTPRFINPVLAQSNADRDLTELVFSSLIDLDQDGSINYRLAKELIVSEDQKTYTLSIHPEARFSDGSHVTAEDLVFTIEKIQSPLIKSPLFSSWAGIKAEETGAREVTFTLIQPYADFIYNLNIGVLPKHFWNDVSDEEFAFNILNTKPVGSGSYTVSRVDYKQNGSPFLYHLNPNRNNIVEPYISKLSVKTYEGAVELVSAYLSGEIDGAYGVSPSGLENIDEDQIHSGSLSRNFGIFFNTENNKDTIGPKVRTALSYAINREQIIAEVFNGFAREINDPMGTNSGTEYDPEQAQKLLIKDGWKQNSEGTFMKSISGKNTPLFFNLSAPNIAEIQAVANIVKTNLAEIGVTVNIRMYEQSDLTNEVIRKRDYDALLFGYILEKPSDAFAFWHSSQRNDPGLNISVYSNPRVDGALSNIRNQQEREDDIDSFIKTWQEDMPAILLYSPEYLYLAPEHINLPESINHASERFNNVSQWYQRTKHIWNFLMKDTQ